MKLRLSLLIFTLFCSHLQATEIFFEKDDRLPITHLNLVFKGGSLQDPEGLSGITDFTAKLMKRGTQSLSREQIDLQLDQAGASLSIEVRNEFIGFKVSSLTSEVPAILDLLLEVLIHPRFSELELHKLKEEVTSELKEMPSRDSTLGATRYQNFFFQNHPFGNSSNGTLSSVSKFNRKNVTAQYQKLIHSGDALLFASGDINENILKDWSKKLDQSKPGVSSFNRFPNFTTNGERRLLLIDKPERTQSQIFIGQTGITMKDRDYDALFLANFAIGGDSLTSRLGEEIRVKNGWAYGVGSFFRMGTQPRNWTISFPPKTKDTIPALKKTLEIVQSLSTKGLLPEEFDSAKNTLLNQAGFDYNTPEKRLSNLMIEKLYQLPKQFFKDREQRIKLLTLDQTNESLKKFLNPKELVFVILGTLNDQRDELLKILEVGKKNAYRIDFAAPEFTPTAF